MKFYYGVIALCVVGAGLLAVKYYQISKRRVTEMAAVETQAQVPSVQAQKQTAPAVNRQAPKRIGADSPSEESQRTKASVTVSREELEQLYTKLHELRAKVATLKALADTRVQMWKDRRVFFDQIQTQRQKRRELISQEKAKLKQRLQKVEKVAQQLEQYSAQPAAPAAKTQ